VIAAYERLLALTREQQTLVQRGLWAEAVAAGEAWQQLVDRLPAQAPDEAHELLAQAADIAWSNTASIEAHVAAVAQELEHIGRGRRALASYAAAGH
jgi:hypothetical protein